MGELSSDGVVYEKKSRWSLFDGPNWEGRCSHCDRIVTKYDFTKEEATASLHHHVEIAHNDEHGV